jgi:molybdate transport system substrate-binding protein
VIGADPFQPRVDRLRYIRLNISGFAYDRAMHLRISLLLALGLCAPVRLAVGDDVRVAVAASFIPPMEGVAAAFEAATDHSVTIVSGSTGGLYAQIVNGAPFDVFVSADAERPRLLEASGNGVAGTRATVALGRLVLLSYDPALVRERGLEALTDPAVRHIAIANPAVAPYGVAAQQTLEALGLWSSLATRLVRGDSVAQTYAMVATGNAQVGFVAMAQVLAGDGTGAFVSVPESYYRPIRQDVIVLARAGENRAALDLRAYLLGTSGQDIIRAHGYATEPP